jgi:hypothetical protein
LVNLNGLNGITSIGLDFDVFGNNALLNLNGLNNLTFLGGSLGVEENPVMTKIGGFNALTSIGGELLIGLNNSLTNITGFQTLTSIGSGIEIELNPLLNNLTGFSSLSSIGVDLDMFANNAMTSLNGFNNLSNVGGSVTIESMPALTSMSGLNSLATVGGEFIVALNPAMTTLVGLSSLGSVGFPGLDVSDNLALSICGTTGVCAYLSNGGAANFENNGIGCNDLFEVQVACGLVEGGRPQNPGRTTRTKNRESGDLSETTEVSIFPNPTSRVLSISMKDEMGAQARLLDAKGRVLFHQRIEQAARFDLSSHPVGVYLLELRFDDKAVRREKIIKE